MNAEVISIGDELTSGQRLDTNSQWLSQRLTDLGVRVLYHSTVGDDLDANVAVFRAAIERADFIVTTGGLGPTADDLTRPALAAATDRPLRRDETALAYIRSLFERRGREMPERNVVQAEFPQGAEVIHNPHGTAPGIDLVCSHENGDARLFALPGVPAEMREMWYGSVEPAIADVLGLGRRHIVHHRIKCFGIGESDLEQRLPDLIRRGRQPTVGITVSQATITLRITAESESKAACQDQIGPTKETIESLLGTLVFGYEDDELQHAICRLLREQSCRLATAEWGPGGLIGNWLSEADPAGDVYTGGIIVRQTQSILETMSQEPSITPAQLAERLARVARERFETDYGLSIGPFPESDEHGGEAGHVYFALDTGEKVFCRRGLFAGHPDVLKPRAAKQALNLLRLALLGQVSES